MKINMPLNKETMLFVCNKCISVHLHHTQTHIHTRIGNLLIAIVKKVLIFVQKLTSGAVIFVFSGADKQSIPQMF